MQQIIKVADDKRVMEWKTQTARSQAVIGLSLSGRQTMNLDIIDFVTNCLQFSTLVTKIYTLKFSLLII